MSIVELKLVKHIQELGLTEKRTRPIMVSVAFEITKINNFVLRIKVTLLN